MRRNFRQIVGRSYPAIAGCIFLVLGSATLVYPEILAYYSIALDQPPARVATRAMLGGGEIGIALLLLAGGRVGFSLRIRSLIAAVIFTCVGLSRVFAVGLEGLEALSVQPLREAAIEIILGGIGLWSANSSKGSDT